MSLEGGKESGKLPFLCECNNGKLTLLGLWVGERALLLLLHLQSILAHRLYFPRALWAELQLQIYIVKTLLPIPPNVIVFGDRVFTEIG